LMTIRPLSGMVTNASNDVDEARCCRSVFNRAGLLTNDRLVSQRVKAESNTVHVNAVAIGLTCRRGRGATIN
jgi:hypothetical protein